MGQGWGGGFIPSLLGTWDVPEDFRRPPCGKHRAGFLKRAGRAEESTPPPPSTEGSFLEGLCLLPASWHWLVGPACHSPEEQVSLLGMQVCGLTCSVPWVTPESPACLHLAVIGLDAYLWYWSP